MLTTSLSDSFKLEVVSDLVVVMTRRFKAPPALVFRAMSEPDLIRQWYLPQGKGYELIVCENDLRVGGKWRNVFTGYQGAQFAFSGVNLAIEAPNRVVFTENFENIGPGHEITVESLLTEEGEGAFFRCVMTHLTIEDRDQHLASGMESGVRIVYDQLDLLAASLARSDHTLV